MTYVELLQFSQQIAHALRDRGVQPGDVVITDLAEELNLAFAEALFHEATIAGCCLGPVDVANAVRADWLVVHRPSPSFPRDRTIVVDEEFLGEVVSLSTSIEPRVYEGFDSVARLVFSSGTTGMPVAVPYSIEVIEGRCRLAEERSLPIRPFMSLVTMVGSLGLRTAYGAVMAGDTYYSPGRVNENVVLLKENYVASLQGSPIQLAALVEYLCGTNDTLADVVAVQAVGSSLSSNLAQTIGQFFNAPVSVAYGSTEGGLVSVIDDVVENALELWRPFHDFDVEIVDDDDRPLSAGEVGELRYRGPYTVDSYFRAEGSGRRSRRNGWVYPGDMARLAADGRFVLKGRATEIINAGGVKLNPTAIDEFVRHFDGVRDAASFAFEAGLGVDGYAVALVTDDGFDVGSLTAPLTDQFEGCAPRYLVRVNAIRRNAGGKVLRAEMAEDLRRTLASR